MMRSEYFWRRGGISARDLTMRGLIRCFSRCPYHGGERLLNTLVVCIVCMIESARSGSMTTPISTCRSWRGCSIGAAEGTRRLATGLLFRQAQSQEGPRMSPCLPTPNGSETTQRASNDSFETGWTRSSEVSLSTPREFQCPVQKALIAHEARRRHLSIGACKPCLQRRGAFA